MALARFCFPASSTHIIESKSFKLYLNSFNQTPMRDADAVRARMQQDLSAAAGGPVEVTLFAPTDFAEQTLGELEGTLLDTLDIDVSVYSPDASLLQADATQSRVETLRSNLLKSNCPVTAQPDWGSLQIEYTGAAIDHASLLKYIISYRGHNGFHEQCVEQIFCDIMQTCAPETLTVYARYTRRGGLDINPWRSTQADFIAPDARNARQ